MSVPDQRNATLYPFIFLSVYLLLILSNHISVADGQLGYWLQEGAIFWKEQRILFSNTFSYTNPDQPLLNHHWLAAALFYQVKQWLGFGGLHVLVVLVYGLVFWRWMKFSQTDKFPIWQLLVGLLALPLLGLHNIVVTALFSHIFTAIFIISLYQFLTQERSFKLLLGLPILQVIWLNCHEYYFLGIFLVLFATLQSLWTQKTKFKPLLGITLLCLGALLAHPQGLGASWQNWLQLWTQHNYLPIQSQSLWLAYQLTRSFSLLYGLCSIVWIIILLIYVPKSNLAAPFFIISSALLCIWASLWNPELLYLLGLWCLFLNYQIGHHILEQYEQEISFFKSYHPLVLIWYPLGAIFIAAQFWWPMHNLGYGLRDGEINLTTFIQQIGGIQGPIFHNAPISGLLVNELGESQKQPLYISNQALAHPDQFYQEAYFPALLDPYSWKAVHDKYQFNAVAFRLKAQPEDQLRFLGNLLSNGKWAMVYYEKDYEVLLLKRAPQNQALIEAYEIQPEADRQ